MHVGARGGGLWVDRVLVGGLGGVMVGLRRRLRYNSHQSWEGFGSLRVLGQCGVFLLCFLFILYFKHR